MSQESFGGMTYAEARLERKALKQKLFAIRRIVEGDAITFTQELKDLKALYESLPGFTNWKDFPEKWEIGDPYGIKASSPQFNDIDAMNLNKILFKPYHEIVHLVRDTDTE